MEKYDLIIVGAGPAGIFTAVELLRHGSKKKMLLVEKGKPVEKRHCPKAEVGHCVNCRPTCAITTGSVSYTHLDVYKRQGLFQCVHGGHILFGRFLRGYLVSIP